MEFDACGRRKAIRAYGTPSLEVRSITQVFNKIHHLKRMHDGTMHDAWRHQARWPEDNGMMDVMTNKD